MKDLFILTADKSIKLTLEILLTRRRESLRIRKLSFDIAEHPNRDPGVKNTGLEFIRALRGRYSKFILIFDYRGCGSSESPESIRKNLLREAKRANMSDNLEVIIINPELEIWVWKSVIHLARIINWEESQIREWLNSNYQLEQGKPKEPKQAFESLLYKTNKKKSSSYFAELAEQVSLENCQNQAFNLLVETLRRWFPQQPQKGGRKND